MAKEQPNRVELLQGTLDMLILRTLLFGPMHGHGIAKHIQRTSDEVLQVEHGSLYPALHRLELKRWLQAEWRPSDTGREAKFYALTKTGRRRLGDETAQWNRVAVAIAHDLKLPIRYVGVGEGIDDLAAFTARDFANAIAGIE